MKEIPIYKASTVEEQQELFKSVAKLGLTYYYPTNFGGKHRWGYEIDEYTDNDHIDDYPYTSVDAYGLGVPKDNHIVSWGNRPHLLSNYTVDCDTVEEFIGKLKIYLDIPAVYIPKNLRRHEIIL
jgi:hypothetical protein